MSRYTERAILATFEKMLEEKPLDRITVTELVKRCEISSNTFYYHYRDIYDLLDAWLAQIKQQYLGGIKPGEPWEDTAKRILRDVKARPRLVHHIFDSISQDRLQRYVFHSLENTFYTAVCAQVPDGRIPEKTMRYLASFCCYSFMGFVLKFLWSDMKMDVDASIDQLSDIFRGCVMYMTCKDQIG